MDSAVIIKEVEVECVETCKYLETVLDNALRWKETDAISKLTVVFIA